MEASSSTTATTAAGPDGQVSLPGNDTLACFEYVLGFCEFSSRCSGDLEGVIPCFEANRDSCPDILFAPGSTRAVDDTFACADAWRALACDVLRPECATAGTRADGEPCVSGIQCASRLCSGSASTCGTCTPSAQQGEPCDDTAGPVCEPGLHCQGADLVCVLDTEPIVGGQEVGEACDPTTSGCYPHVCVSDVDGVYHCERYPTLGEDCSFLFACAYGDSYCDPTLVCAALPAAGEPCGVDGSSGAAQWCAEGLACDATLDPPRCLSTPEAPGVGDACEAVCQTGLTCRCTDDACASKTCLWARLNGESCGSPEDACLMGECVDGTCVVSEVESTFAERCGE